MNCKIIWNLACQKSCYISRWNWPSISCSTLEIHELTELFVIYYSTPDRAVLWRPSVLWCCWLGGRKGIQPVKNLSDGMLAWLCVWVKVQIFIWTIWCHCHLLSVAPVNSDWFYLSGASLPWQSWQNPEGRKMKWLCVCACVRPCVCMHAFMHACVRACIKVTHSPDTNTGLWWSLMNTDALL